MLTAEAPKDPMRSLSVTVRMTPRQAVAAARSCESSGYEEPRAFAARHRIIVALEDAGWTWDDGTETWSLDTRTIPDRL